MSIELSSMASSPKAMTGAESGKGRIRGGDEERTSGKGGFSEVLTSLDSPVDQNDVANKSAASEDKPETAETSASDRVASQPLPVPTEISMLLAQANQVVRNSATDSVPAVPDAPTEASMLLAQADGLLNNELGTLGEGRLMVGAGGSRLKVSATAGDTLNLDKGTSASLGADKTEDFKQGLDSLVDQSAPALGSVHKARGVALQSAAAASLTESRAFRQTVIADAAARESAVSGALLASSQGDEFLHQVDRAGAKPLAQTMGSGIEGIWGQPAFQAGHHVDAPSAVADASLVAPEKTVADTVSYWVTQGVQNAELMVDGFGETPVAVSISLKGDEARIDFRTDQPEVRQILEGAVAHLKDLLSSEGLVLSGVSVGGSGQGGAGSQEQRNRPEARQATVATPTTGGPESLPRVRKPGSRALDLYV